MTGNEQRLFIATCCNAPTLSKYIKEVFDVHIVLHSPKIDPRAGFP